MIKDVFICSCGSFEHQMYFWYEKEYDYVYAEVHLAGRSFWQRLKYGMKYIFGYKSRFGAWDEFIFDPESHEKLLKFLNKNINYGKKTKQTANTK